MLDVERVNLTITEAAPLDEEILEVRRLDDDRWGVVIDEEVVELECDVQLGRLVFMGSIGALPADKRVALLEILMSYNTLWRVSGNVRTALNGPGGNAVVLFDLAEAEITPASIAAAVKSVAVRALQWRALAAASRFPDAAASVDAGTVIFKG